MRKLVKSSLVCSSIGCGAAIALLLAGSASAEVVPLRILTDAAAPTDVPFGVNISDAGDGGIRADTISLLATKEGADYYVGQDGAGNVCLLLYVEQSDVTASACASPEVLETYGIALAVTASPPGVVPYTSESYLVPDELKVDSTALAASGLEQIAPNLLVGDGDESRELGATLDVGEREGADFVIPLYAPAEQ